MTKMTYDQQIHILKVIHDAINYLIMNPQHQTSDAMARNAYGVPVSPTAPSACSWCALGRVAHDLGFDTKLDRYIEQEFIATFLHPLGYNSRLFIRHNDVSDGQDRTESLTDLLTLVGYHPTLLTGRAS